MSWGVILWAAQAIVAVLLFAWWRRFRFSTKLPRLSRASRKETLRAFGKMSEEWERGWGEEGQEQPDRLRLMQDFGSSQFAFPLLICAYRAGSLQSLVRDALRCDDEKAELIAANMVQVSHMGYPDLAGTMDYTSKWRRA